MDNFDVLVVGGGPTGLAAARTLSRRGLAVALIEAGPRVQRPQDRLVQPIQSTAGLFHASTRHFYVDDRENPYEQKTPFSWIRGRQLGGRLHTWGRTCVRMSDEHMKKPAWPICASDLASEYAEAEQLFDVSGQCDGIAQIPDGPLHSLRRETPALQVIRKAFVETFADAPIFGSRNAERAPTEFVKLCTERVARLIDNAVVDNIVWDGNRAAGVTFIETQTAVRQSLKARAVVLCASTIESLRILLRSGARLRAGLSNEPLGHFLMDHLHDVAVVPWPKGPWHDYEDTSVPFLVTLPQPSMPFSVSLAAPQIDGQRTLIQWCFGEVAPRSENRVTLSTSIRDKWGLSVPAIRLSYDRSDLATRGAFVGVARRMCASLALEEPRFTHNSPGASVHEVGGARMGLHAETSVVDSFGAVWGHAGLFVLDGAIFPRAPFHNPTLTMVSLAIRGANRLAQQLGAS